MERRSREQRPQTSSGYVADLEAERAILTVLLTKPEAAAEILANLSSVDFTIGDHKAIFEASAELFGNGKPIDVVTVTAALRKQGMSFKPREILVEFAGNYSTHANLMRDLTRRRNLQTALNDTLARIAGRERCDDVMADLMNKAEVASRRGAAKIMTAGEILVMSQKRLENAIERHDHNFVVGVPTGLRSLDERMGGWKPGELIVVGARTKLGKSAFLVNVAVGAARVGFASIVVSAEMELVDIGTRMLAGETGIPNFDLRRGKVDYEDIAAVSGAANMLSKLPLQFLNDRRWDTIKVKLMAYKRTHPELAMVMIDYVQRIGANYLQGERRYEQLGRIMKEAKDIATDLQVAVVVAAQLRRPPPEMEKKAPTLESLRESGDIEQEADIVLLLHRYDPKKEEQLCYVIIAKNRGGPEDTVRLRWSPGRVRFYDMED